MSRNKKTLDMITESDLSDQFVTILAVSKKDGAYCLSEYLVPDSVFKRNFELKWQSEPDFFQILLNHMERKSREILGI